MGAITFAELMKRIGVILIMSYVLVSTFSLSLQEIYKNYFCTDTKEYLTIAGRQITVCGKTCDFEVQDSDSDEGSHYVYNFDAPSLYFELYEIQCNKHQLVTGAVGTYINLYQSTYSPSNWQPPRG